MTGLNEQTAVVTGGGSGVGRALCEALVAAGARVIAADINVPAATETAAALGAHCEAFELDVTSAASWQSLASYVDTTYGGCDILCNNAGVFRVGALAGSPLEDWHLQSRINIDGVILGCHTMAPAMAQRGRGVIVNTASLSGLLAAPELSTYTASKFAVVGFSQALRQELADSGVRVMILVPGAVDTPMNHGVDVPLEDRLIPPQAVAAEVVRACTDHSHGQYIFTHPEFRDLLAQSYQATLDEYRDFNQRVEDNAA